MLAPSSTTTPLTSSAARSPRACRSASCCAITAAIAASLMAPRAARSPDDDGQLHECRAGVTMGSGPLRYRGGCTMTRKSKFDALVDSALLETAGSALTRRAFLLSSAAAATTAALIEYQIA